MAAIALPSVPELMTDMEHNWPSVAFRLVFRFGPQAAFLFVFLSGFMVAGPLLADLKEGNAPLAKTFFQKRFKRIMPISVGAVLLTAILDKLSCLSPGAETLYRNSYVYDMVGSFNWTNFIGNMLFLQPTIVDSFGSNGPLWTLGYIVQYYVVGWVLCKINVSSRIIALIGFGLILIGTATIHPEWAVLFISWIAGGIARHLQVSKRLAVPFIFLGMVLFVLSNLSSTIISAATSIPIGFFLIPALRHLPEATGPINTIGQLRMLASNSYTVYAVHHPVLMSVFAVLFSGVAVPATRFYMYVAVSIAAVIAATTVLNLLVRLPTYALEAERY